jgi:hypothetical protein
VYNGKDRSFFFASVELLRQGEAASARMNVPTLKMRSGDFSEVNTPIYNPYSVATINGVPTRTPFPNNVIPVSLQDPVGKALMNYWPTPNLFPSVSPWVSDLAQGCKFNTPMEMSTVKFDQNISSKAQLSIRVNKGQGRPVNPCASDPNYPVAGIATTSSYLMVRPNSGFGINYTYIFSPRVVAAFRIGMGRLAELETPFSNGFDIASLGFPSSLANSEQAKAFPIVNFSDGIQSLGYSLFDKYWGDTYSSSNSVTIASGSHMFKAGGDIRVLRGDWWSTQSPTGSFSFAPNQTGGPNASAPSGGFGLASMLLGFGSSGSYGLGTGVSWQGAYYALFFQDDFRVTSKLTLNLGLRWEYDGPRHERYNRTVRGFAYGATSPLSVPALNLRGGLEYAGVNGQPRGLYDSNFRNFSPRIGFAYSLTGKTILRAGYALMYVPITPAMIPLGFTVSTPWITSTDGITVHAPLSNPFPNGQLPLTGNTQGLGTLVGQAVQFAEPSDVIGQYHTWQFNIQRALPSSAVLQVAYVGGRGIRLQSPSVNIDQVPTGMFSMGSGLTATVPNPFYGILPSTSSLGGTTVQEAQLLRPYPQFTGVTRVSPAYGNSHYNSVQVTYQKSLAQGLSGLVTYTISKNIADTNTPQDIYNLQTARGLASFDVPSRMSVALAWNLPFGQKRRFLTNANKATDLVIGGWALSTNEVFQGGMPMSFGVSGGTYFSNTTRPNVVGDPTAGVTGSIDSRLNHYFNTAAFARPTNFTIGNLSANIGTVRTPGMNQVHMTLGKSFQIREKRSVELRITAYNLLNHPMFGSPNTTTGSAAFGVISSQQNLGRQIESMLKIHF